MPRELGPFPPAAAQLLLRVLLAACAAAPACASKLCADGLDAALEGLPGPLTVEGTAAWTLVGSSPPPCTEGECRLACEVTAERVRGPVIRRDGGAANDGGFGSDAVAPQSYAMCVNRDSGDRTMGTCFCGPSREQAAPFGRRLGPCLLVGRDGRCLYTADEFPGCLAPTTRPGAAATDCIPICTDLAARQAADAETAYEASAHGARCAGSQCECVLRIGDACYASGFHAYACTLSADEILRQDRDRQERERKALEQATCR